MGSAGGPNRRRRVAALDERQNYFIKANRETNTKHSIRRKTQEDEGKTNSKFTPLRGRLPTRTVDSKTESKTTHIMPRKKKTVLNKSPQEHGRGFWNEETVPLGERGVKALIQRRASVRSLLYKPSDEGIKNRCALVGTRVRCTEVEAMESGALQGPWEEGETPPQHGQAGAAEPSQSRFKHSGWFVFRQSQELILVDEQ